MDATVITYSNANVIPRHVRTGTLGQILAHARLDVGEVPHSAIGSVLMDHQVTLGAEVQLVKVSRAIKRLAHRGQSGVVGERAQCPVTVEVEEDSGIATMELPESSVVRKARRVKLNLAM